MNRKLSTLTAIALVALIVVSLFIALNAFSNQTPGRQFYLGVEYAYGHNQTAQFQVAQIEALVNKVKDYTNLFVIGSVSLTFNQTALTQACDYIYNNTKLNFIVLFTGGDMYSYNIVQWMFEANDKYGDRFLGIYKYDEPGGNQIDNTPSQLINKTIISPDASYSAIANNYVGNLSFMVNFYRELGHVNLSTADYGLYWFDYKSNYTAIYAEFVGNESRQRIIALDRGAARAFGKDWGVIVNWKYNNGPYLESGTELYTDLSLAYSAGAKYAIVFSYPTYPDNNPYGILQDEHFEALQKFWNTLHNNPSSFGSNKAEAAYIVPKDYGFGFRHPNDTIWGLKPADELSQKIFNDTNKILPAKYGSRFDILYDEPEVIAPLLQNYTAVYYWNQTIP
ncbi:MAG: hypothetical protein M1167_02250 [Chloroflexi bacterium]|nr:hypothetical protein [Chloroflexota bacterium]MCL5949139.1 hypothetical protein [Candidatus Bathyarchaeota archaeon]